jgi:hypothetical protein
MQCEGKLKLRSHNPGYLLIEVVNKADLARAVKRILGLRAKGNLAPSSNSPNNDTQTKSTTVCHKQGRISTTKMN